MPTARPYWKGYIKLALVSCPIAVYTASSSGERVAFRQINKKTGNRRRQQFVDEVTREPVEAADKGRGYEYAKNAYLLIEDEEIESIEVESNHMIEIDSFVPRSQIDERYLDSLYAADGRQDGCGRDRDPEESEKAHPRPGRAIAANCRAKSRTQRGSEAHKAACGSTQGWVVTVPRLQIVSKRTGSRYIAGTSRTWLKCKNPAFVRT